MTEQEERELIMAKLTILEALSVLLQPVEVEAFRPPVRVWVDPVDVAREASKEAA